MTAEALALRRRIMTTFAATGAPPEVRDDAALRELEAARVVVVARGGGSARIHLAHPFAGHHGGTRVDAGGRSWWGSCAWDGLGIVAALGLPEATLAGGGVALAVRGGAVAGDAVFHVAVPAGWWREDIGFT